MFEMLILDNLILTVITKKWPNFFLCPIHLIEVMRILFLPSFSRKGKREQEPLCREEKACACFRQEF